MIEIDLPYTLSLRLTKELKTKMDQVLNHNQEKFLNQSDLIRCAIMKLCNKELEEIQKWKKK